MPHLLNSPNKCQKGGVRLREVVSSEGTKWGKSTEIQEPFNLKQRFPKEFPSLKIQNLPGHDPDDPEQACLSLP